MFSCWWADIKSESSVTRYNRDFFIHLSKCKCVSNFRSYDSGSLQFHYRQDNSPPPLVSWDCLTVCLSVWTVLIIGLSVCSGSGIVPLFFVARVKFVTKW
ncbi:hypothetical protein J6590_094456 [Homalodisca vitripennis]|nr:hypothetical protein J6590_094456 [Homalodisca vitripennis]